MINDRSKPARAIGAWVAALAIIVSGPAVWADSHGGGEHPQTEHPTEAEHPEHPAADNGGESMFAPLSLDVGLDFVTQYFFRGILQEDDGVIAQPWLEIGVPLYEGAEGDAINSITATLGWWNSLHDKHTGTDNDGPSAWYEADYYAGVSAGIFDVWEMGLTYTLYNSPNAAFDDVQEVAVSLAYDDSGFWESAGVSAPGFGGLGPYIMVAVETRNAADGLNDGVYIELGIEPGLTPLPESLPDLGMSFPVTVGLSGDDYYEGDNDGDGDFNDSFFGYAEVGMSLSYDLTDRINVYGGVHVIFLGSTPQDINDSGSDEVIGKFGISYSF